MIRRCKAWELQLSAMKPAASSSSNSGGEGGELPIPRLSVVGKMPRPKCRRQIRFTCTRPNSAAGWPRGRSRQSTNTVRRPVVAKGWNHQSREWRCCSRFVWPVRPAPCFPPNRTWLESRRSFHWESSQTTVAAHPVVGRPATRAAGVAETPSAFRLRWPYHRYAAIRERRRRSSARANPSRWPTKGPPRVFHPVPPVATDGCYGVGPARRPGRPRRRAQSLPER